MTEHVNTQPAGTRTFRAFISIIADGHRRRTVVMMNPDSLLLPLSDVDVAVGPDELFVVNAERRDTRYFEDLEEAWQFSRNNGGWGSPDAIQILSPLEKDGIKVWNLIPVHQCAVSVNR